MRYLFLSLVLFAVAVANSKDLQKVNVNTAPADSLSAHLPGIGPAIAERIVSERAAGKYDNCTDLQARTPGLGSKKMAKICPLAVF